MDTHVIIVLFCCFLIWIILQDGFSLELGGALLFLLTMLFGTQAFRLSALRQIYQVELVQGQMIGTQFDQNKYTFNKQDVVAITEYKNIYRIKLANNKRLLILKYLPKPPFNFEQGNRYKDIINKQSFPEVKYKIREFYIT